MHSEEREKEIKTTYKQLKVLCPTRYAAQITLSISSDSGGGGAALNHMISLVETVTNTLIGGWVRWFATYRQEKSELCASSIHPNGSKSEGSSHHVCNIVSHRNKYVFTYNTHNAITKKYV